MRFLDVIPTIHSDEENPLMDFQHFGDEEVNERTLKVNEVAQKHWDVIRQTMVHGYSSYKEIKLFAEGTTLDNMKKLVADGEREYCSSIWVSRKDEEEFYSGIEKHLAENVQILSPQLALLMFLYARGANIVECDDMKLIDESFRLLKERNAILIGEDLDTNLREDEIMNLRDIAREMDEIQKQRDAFIANSINSNLNEGETGILIFGSNHDVRPLLQEDIIVRDANPKIAESMKEVRKELGLDELKSFSSEFESSISSEELKSSSIDGGSENKG